MKYSISKETLDASPSVFPWTVDGETVFVKKKREVKNPLGRMAQQALYRLTGNILVLPTAPPPEDRIAAESGKIRRLGTLGVPVPTIHHVTGDYFVMSEAGRPLQKVLKTRRDEAGVFAERAIRELRRLHDLGEIHGGPQIKNITLKDDKLYFIDFEENIPDRDFELYRLRDIFLFLLSLERHRHDPDIAGLCRAYGDVEGVEMLPILCRELAALRPSLILDSKLLAFLSMRDIRSLTNLVRKALATAAAGHADGPQIETAETK